jgi:ABC-2 type transport system permease protein
MTMTSPDTVSPLVELPQDVLSEVRNDMSHQLRATWVVTRRELLRLKQDKARMVTMLLQPLLFIFVMGTGLGSIVDTGGGTSFSTFLFPGVLATSVLFTAAFAGISLVWDREFGFLREMMVAPISRASIIWGKCLGGAIVATGQSLVLLLLVGTVGIPYDPALLLGLVGCLFLGALLLTALGVLLSTRINTIQAAMPVSQLLIMPMMFLSGSLFPISGLPDWLAVLTRLNPLTYVVQPMRYLVLDHLSLTAAEQERLVPVITWFGWHVPVGVQLGTVAVITLGLCALAARIFTRAE